MAVLSDPLRPQLIKESNRLRCSNVTTHILSSLPIEGLLCALVMEMVLNNHYLAIHVTNHIRVYFIVVGVANPEKAD